MAKKRHRLQRVRKSTGLSQEDVAHRLGVETSTVWRWEAGETEPSAWQQPRLAKLLGVCRAELVTLLTEVAIETDQEELPAAVRSVPGKKRADLAIVEALAAQLRELGEQYEGVQSTSLLAPASRCHALVTNFLAHGASSRVTDDLHRLATESATLMSQLVWDASQRRDATGTLAYCDEARHHASEVGDHVAAAKADLRKAYVSLYGEPELRNPRPGLALAQQAAEQSKPASQALYGVSLLHVGEAFGMLGEYRQCERALSDAETAFSSISDDDPAADWFSETQFGRLAGSCYLSLGSAERAESYLTQTAERLQDRPKSRSLVLGNLALAYLRQRELDAATATLHNAIDLLGQSRGAGGMTVVFGAARELYPWREESAVQDVQDRLLALMS